ncbi:FecCD family ABC transporter permease [Campylobacter corcagiensis]|uniref:Iron ABC transporter permease n=1 Tax=Campylobacter corcagiensis TaxID=1448857 RepID=A0A7M1LE78_9BACT|nr:iron ABC transporter permease [Campylobacter corcagiensis]QKF64986.1 ABC transporter, permease protein [Campylobacter corcagiensis]QOQ86858.1 iron ABC transporter permease [Campylobacter corcagiensis]
MLKVAFLSILWLIFGLYSLKLGQIDASFSEIFKALFESDNTLKSVILDIRLPRVLISSFCGGILGLCGICLQGLFKNILVDPKIIGVSTAASFGGCLAILYGFSGFWLICCAFGFGILGLFLLFYIASFVRNSSIYTFILAGIIINGFFGALISLTQYLADSEEVLPNIVFWLMGSFVASGYDELKILLIIGTPCIAMLILMRWRFNLLSLDEKDLKALKVNLNFLRIFILTLTTLFIATQVSISGNIGWVGLIVPHMARLLSGVNHLKSIPSAFLIGMIFMLLVDNLARTLSQSEIPIGIISALVGAPIFAYLLKRSYKSAN